jgi:hypothetical protein
MKRLVGLVALLGLLAFGPRTANAVTLIGGSVNNGNLDKTHATEVAPGFFLPKPDVWVYEGSRTISGPYEDGLSSETWAGPAPTPVTTDGSGEDSGDGGCSGLDCGVFFKAFGGNASDGAVNAQLYQDNPATEGLTYTLEGWAGAEANFDATDAQFAIDFLNAANDFIGGETLSLPAAGLFIPNGEPFNYKKYSVSAIAPPGTVSVRTRISMLDGFANPLGGGQAFVVDDFRLTESVPEPSALTLIGLGLFGLIGLRRSR